MFLAVVGIAVPSLIAVVLWLVSRRDTRRARIEDQRRMEQKAREDRIERVTRVYIDNNLHDAGMSGALSAGVLSLKDWSEVRDFCQRVDQRLPRIPVIPVNRGRIPDQALLVFFQRLSMIDNWGARPDSVEGLINELIREFAGAFTRGEGAKE